MNDNIRRYAIQIAFIVIGLLFLIKLFSIQVLDSNYQIAAENNVVEKVVQYPFRGLIYDRNGKLLVYNEPVYDLEVIPKEVAIKDTAAFCGVFNITEQEFVEKLQKAKKYSSVKPSVFLKQISNKNFAFVQEFLVDYPGFRIQAKSDRGYSRKVMANALGYIGEINKSQLNRDSMRMYYRQGDNIGITGIESKYEPLLRGKTGVQFKLVNVRGVEKGAFKDGELDTLSTPGENLQVTIDLDLQEYGETLMAGKVGSLVAIEPETGDILSIISAPTYNPDDLSGKDYGKNYSSLNTDSLRPLFNRPIMAMYPPGSIFKTVQSLIGMQEGVLTPKTTYYCGDAPIGDHAPPGYYDLHKALEKSSNQYFYKAFRAIINQGVSANTFTDSQLGLEKWSNYVEKFGLGKPLGIDIPSERGGYIPTPSYYDKIYGEGRWKFSTIYSLSIGQGEMLITPIQMANLAAIIANKGYYVTPHIIKSIGEHGGMPQKYVQKNDVGINPDYFNVVHDAMADAIYGTAGRAAMKDIVICGKTGTAENPHGEDHSVFMAFAPKENPKIAIAVYVENAGWGGRAAASTASLMIEKYLKGCVERVSLEEYVLKGEFIY